MKSTKEGRLGNTTTEISTGYQINPATVLKGMNLLVMNKYLKNEEVWTFVAEGQKIIYKQNEFLLITGAKLLVSHKRSALQKTN